MDDRYNLVYNGNFKNGADGWSTGSVFTLDTAMSTNGSYGSLYTTGTPSWSFLPYANKIPIDTACTYNFQFDRYVSASASSWNYSFFPVYDKYDTEVGIYMVNHAGDTTLAADLKNGDTAVTLTNAATFYLNTKNNWYRIGICDSPAWGYNRHIYNAYYVASATNTTTNVIILNSAWAGGTWKAGTPVARFNDGSTYIYPTYWNSAVLNTWQHFNVNIEPSLWRYSAINMMLCQSVASSWRFYMTNISLTNTTNAQEREYNGTVQQSGGGFCSIKKTGVAEGNSVHETSTQNVRYIRDFCSGSTANNDNHWCEIQAWDKYGRNVALGSVGSATTRAGVYSLISSITKSGVNNSSNANYIKTHAITKGTPSPASTYIGLGATQGIIIDLGQVFEIETIKIWHYWGGTRTYHNVKTEISEDKVNWKTVFDSSVSGEYAETSDGLTISFNKTNMSITKAGIYKTNALYEI
jgi:hypothetical protein